MNLICMIFGALFLVFGIWLGFCGGYRHIPAWKAMTEKERAQINIKALSRNAGEVIMLSGIIFLLKGFGVFFTEHRFVTAMIAWLVVAGLDVLYISKSPRFRRASKKGR